MLEKACYSLSYRSAANAVLSIERQTHTGANIMNRYTNKTIAELLYIQKDAFEAAQCAKDNCDMVAECKYLDQMNDASTELYKRLEGK